MSLFSQFVSCKRGSFAVMAALMMVPLTVGVGASIDYSRLVNVRSRLQSAADATALAMAKEASKLSDTDLQTKGIAFFDARFADQAAGLPFHRTLLTISRNAKVVQVSVAGTVPTTLMKLAGIAENEISAGSQSAWGTRKIEVALVLDNTGSMASSGKLVEMKKAAKNLVSTLETVATEPGAVKISLVPFATQVRLDTSLKDASWLDFATTGTNKATWTGCVKDRTQPADVTDGGPTLYPAVNCAAGTLAPMRPLSTDFAGLRTAIDGMNASGNTNITIGLAWGLTMLSPAEPMTGAADFGADGVEKFIIMLTDGDNTQNAWSSSKYDIDLRTTAACNDIKAPARKTSLYTIRVINGDANLLRSCATSPAQFFDVKNATELDAVFRKIADEIASIRLTM